MPCEYCEASCACRAQGFLPYEDVIARIGEDRAQEWADFIRGQTAAFCPDEGKVFFYPWDVERFEKRLPVVD